VSESLHKTIFADIGLDASGSFGRSEKLARRRGSHERLLFRSLNQLKQIQQERALLATDKTVARPAHIPPAVRLKPLFAHLKSLSKHRRTLAASASAQTTRLAWTFPLRKQRRLPSSRRLTAVPRPAAA